MNEKGVSKEINKWLSGNIENTADGYLSYGWWAYPWNEGIVKVDFVGADRKSQEPVAEKIVSSLRKLGYDVYSNELNIFVRMEAPCGKSV